VLCRTRLYDSRCLHHAANENLFNYAALISLTVRTVSRCRRYIYTISWQSYRLIHRRCRWSWYARNLCRPYPSSPSRAPAPTVSPGATFSRLWWPWRVRIQRLRR